MRVGFGVDVVVDRHASLLSELGHEVTVYCVFEDGTYEDVPYDIVRVPLALSDYPWIADARARAAAEATTYWRDDHDVSIVHTAPFFSLLGRLPGLEIAVDHGVSPRSGRPLRERAAAAWMERQQVSRYFPQADVTVAISDFVRRQLPAPLRDETLVIGHGADHYGQSSNAARATVRSRLGLADDEVMALYVGRLNAVAQPYKGVSALVSLLRGGALGPSTKLVLVGFGDAADVDQLEAAGAIAVACPPPGEMASYYAAADVYVTASRWEGFDLPLLEAQNAGVPVVALDVGSHREVVRSGETGILAATDAELGSAVARLASDAAVRRRMGDAGIAFAADHRWSDAALRYHRLVGEALDTPSLPAALRPGVSALILNYESEPEELSQAVRSLLLSGGDRLSEVLIVDNGSVSHAGAPEQIRRELEATTDVEIRVLSLGHNWGYAGGINRGIDACEHEYVFLLNADAEVEPDAIDLCAARLDASPETCVGVVPKILLRSYPGYIDSVGNAITPEGSAFNVGIGCIDIGQYDVPELSFGPCFAAAFLRRDAFSEQAVGRLDETYFMYYEDVDWNWRANLLGYDFVTEPMARVLHTHSGSAGKQPYRFKYHLIERNLLLTVTKNLSGGSMRRVVLRRLLSHLRNIAHGSSIRTSLRIIAGYVRLLPEAREARRHIQSRRVRSDSQVSRFAIGEEIFFDGIAYRPMRTLRNLAFAFERRSAVTGSMHDDHVANVISRHAPITARHDPSNIRRHLEPFLVEEPETVREFVREWTPENPVGPWLPGALEIGVDDLVRRPDVFH
jgi:GT2 family glycosyltransferase/glycosyltransferase involved in cell wall biosynthesis